MLVSVCILFGSGRYVAVVYLLSCGMLAVGVTLNYPFDRPRDIVYSFPNDFGVISISFLVEFLHNQLNPLPRADSDLIPLVKKFQELIAIILCL